MNKFFKKIKELIKAFFKDPLFLRHWERPWNSHQHNDNQLSVRISGHNKRSPYIYKGYSSMFIEDMYAGIMPFMMYRGSKEKYPARIEPVATPQKQRMISNGISQRERTAFLEDALCEFVRNTTQSLLSDGVVFYEIIYERDEAGEIKSFDFEFLDSFYLFQFYNSYYQIVPWWKAKESQIRAQIVKIPAEKVFRIDFPKQYGGKKKVYKILKRLWQLTKEFMPEFYIESRRKDEDTGFELKEYSKIKYLEIAKITKGFGWNQRQTSDNYISEYYSMQRFLRTKRFEATIRGHIITKLNEALNRAPLNLNTKIIIENLFSVEAVEEQERLLEQGGIKFMDIFNKLNI